MKNSNLKGKIVTKKPIKLNELSVPFEVSSTEIPKPAVGREYAMSFWLYVEQFEQSINNKLIFYRGAKDRVDSASSVVMMDSNENKMYIAIKTQDNGLPGLGDSNENLKNIIKKNYFKSPTYSGSDVNKYIILEVDYVPLQRWVNFVVIVDNKVITMFMDGEIYSVKSTDELKAVRKPILNSDGSPQKINLIVDKTDGDVFIGKNSINNKITVNGYLSGLAFHNYAISLNQVKSVYNAGPLAGGGFLASMGVQWGVRSPVYRLNQPQE
jgi:hypothetical protein